MRLAAEVAGKTDVGCVRTNNEDNFGYDLRLGIFVVCDGMGGQAAGEVASKLGVDTLLSYFRNGQPPAENPETVTTHTYDDLSSRGQALASAVSLANKTIYQAGQQQAAQAGMGSTVVAALVDGNALSIANVGDSRIYLIRQGVIQQLTQDHSLVMEQVRRGIITREQAEHSEVQNIILKALGSEETVDPDVEDLVVVPGDILLMNSDGLTKYVRDEEILKFVTAAPSLEQACEALIQAAKDRGGDDNITCLLVKIVEQRWYQGIFQSRSSVATSSTEEIAKKGPSRQETCIM